MRWSVKKFPTVSSTQDAIKARIKENNFREGLVVQADVQTSGRGRHGRVWESLDGNLFFSFLIIPRDGLRHAGLYSLLTGLSIAKALSEFMDDGPEVTIKWPNDVFIDGRKCAGLLLEAERLPAGEYALIVGVGLNVALNPDEHSACLCEYSDYDVDLDEIREEILEHVTSYSALIESQAYHKIFDDWKTYAYKAGTPMSVTVGTQVFSGAFHDIDENGSLLLKGEQGNIQKITAGDVYIHAAGD